jgi:hypothetical protein
MRTVHAVPVFRALSCLNADTFRWLVGRLQMRHMSRAAEI